MQELHICAQIPGYGAAGCIFSIFRVVSAEQLTCVYMTSGLDAVGRHLEPDRAGGSAGGGLGSVIRLTPYGRDRWICWDQELTSTCRSAGASGRTTPGVSISGRKTATSAGSCRSACREGPVRWPKMTPMAVDPQTASLVLGA
jgi:hypothetical protein